MKVLITGVNGTVAPVLAEALAAAGHTWTAWDRGEVSPENPGACRRFLDASDPDAVAHLALGAEAWAERLAAWCAERGRRFLFTSTAMVFDHQPDGPHRPEDARTARDGYGQYKIRCEDLIQAAHPGALVVRIGWQIGAGRGGNNMIEALHQAGEREGRLRASRRWVPATSFVSDTCALLAELLAGEARGTWHLDGNAECAWTYERLVRALQVAGRVPPWPLEVTEDYVHDQRLLDARLQVPSLAERLGE